ncbi:MAG: DUF1670 domain-containing protein [Candidatus Cloacimonetes bacterium]|nr:DUF1670 domain-containing protein [Candidatus Cloacimonadota bacterium]
MLPVSSAYKHYNSAHKRFLKPAIEHFFQTEFSKSFGPNIRSFIADELIKIFNDNNQDINSIKPGQVLWNAVHKDTRADYYKMKLVPVILTLVNDDDISMLKGGLSIYEHRQNVVARILREAYAQNALLSMRDVSLLLSIGYPTATKIRKNYEEMHKVTLPHPGNLQDMGSSITHKYQIVYKCIVDKKDPLKVAKETNHTIEAVDRYLKDFNRVKTLYLDSKDVNYIHVVTNLSKQVITQNIEIIKSYIIETNTAT